MLKSLTFMFLILLGTACVGTIDKAEPDKTKYLERTGEKIEYQGIDEANAIAQDKIEIYFFPFVGSSTVDYKLYVNESKTPIEIQPDSIALHPDGRLRFVLKDLNSGESYLLRIAAKDSNTGAESENEKIFTVVTYSSPIANFSGVEQVKLFPGQTSSKVILKWVSAPFTASLGSAPFDPSKYEITMVTETAGLENINNPDYPLGENKRIIQVPGSSSISRNNNPGEEIIENLKPQTKYYFQVRMIHYLAWQNRNNSAVYKSIQKDANTKVVEVTTEATTGLFDFNTQGVAVESAQGDEAFSKLLVTWRPGAGSFKKYAVFFKKVYTEGEAVVDPNSTDLLDSTTLQSIVDSPTNTITVAGQVVAGRYYVSSQYNYFLLENLTRYTNYQVKVALCRSSVDCDIEKGNGFDAVVSGFKVGSTYPSLPPFSGIISILNPESIDAADEITMTFNPPTLSLGFADKLKIWCLDPSDQKNKTRAVEVTTGGTGVGNTISACNNLSLDSAISVSSESAIIKGINAFDQVQYCFGMTTNITEKVTPVQIAKELDFDDMVVRCVYPEIALPTNTEFLGFKNSCSVNQNQATLTWDKPTTGVYGGYKIFYRAVEGSETFSFADALTGAPEYTEIDLADPDLVQKTILSLQIGKKYLMGILAYFQDANDPSNILYSEYNLGIKECNIPLPGATFAGFRRIFAVGPKVNGLYPRNYNSGDVYSDESYIWETMDDDGLVYEVADPLNLPVGDATKEKPRTVSGQLKAASNRGIISLAWKDVKLSSGFYDSEFATGQSVLPLKYGYYVYRSENNRLSWTLLNPDNLIHSATTVYNRRPNDTTDISEKISFFTDYSVNHAPAQSEVGRAKIYYYRIVPIFNGKPVAYENNLNVQEVKVILPPEGMALVNRKMANRASCLELGKDLEPAPGGFVTDDEHYRCYYNGLGNSPLGFPWSSDALVIDQGGDLLVDRFEMGCSFTRGQKQKTNYSSNLALFNSADMTAEKGCTTSWSNTGMGTLVDGSSNYDKLLDGDCIGTSVKTMHTTTSGCTLADSNFQSYDMVFPGADRLPDDTPCPLTTNYDDNTSTTGRRSMVAQSEFAAVFFNQKISSNPWQATYEVGPQGNITNETSETLDCNINLASLDSSNYSRARWFSLNRLDKSDLNLLDKTLTNVLSNAKLYNTTTFKAPNASSDRYKTSTKIARIMTGNESKLPLLSNVKQDTAQKICSTYSVQLGVSSTSGQFFSVTSNLPKRLLRKREFVAAANHSELLVKDVMNPIDRIEAIEKDECVNVDNVKANTVMNSSRPKYSSILNDDGYVANHGVNAYAVSGSAKTKKCVSKYGIQDMIGNIKEVGAEKLFCDFSQEKIDIVTYHPSGAGDSLVPVVGSNRIYKDAIYQEIPINAQPAITPAGAEQLMFGGSLSTNGYCSIVDKDFQNFDPLAYQNSTGFLNTFDENGNLNTAIVKNVMSYDQKAVDGLRNGDGTFFHTGKGYLAPSMSAGQNRVQIYWPSEASGATSGTSESHTNWAIDEAPYFNPIAGFPLECGSEVGSCNSTGDNKLFTRDASNSALIYYDQGRSTVSPIQLDQHNKSRISYDDEFWARGCVPVGQSGNQCGAYDIALITKIKKCTDPNGCPAHGLNTFGQVSFEQKTISQVPVSPSDPTPLILTADVEYEEFGWGSNFGKESFEFIYGNDYRAPAGRFGLEFLSRGTDGQSEDGVGMRCSVLIEE